MATTQFTTYPFTLEEIDQQVEADRPGTYVLYHSQAPKYVGRSGVDLKQELKARFHSSGGDYEAFAFEYAGDAVQAFRRECELYHQLGGDRGRLDNKIHPAVPKGSECPVCHQRNDDDGGGSQRRPVVPPSVSPGRRDTPPDIRTPRKYA